MQIKLGKNQIRLTDDAIVLRMPDYDSAMATVRTRAGTLARWAKEFDRPVTLVEYTGCRKPIHVPAILAENDDEFQNETIASQVEPATRSIASAANSQISRIDPDASFQEIQEYLAEHQRRGLIVTMMSHLGAYEEKSDRFLHVNDQQVIHRAGGWGIVDWVGANARDRVWLESFRSGNHNFYEELYRRLDADGFIDEWGYEVLRPNGAKWRDVTSYRKVNDYCGIPVRIAISGTSDRDSELIMTSEELRDRRRKNQ